MTRLRLCALIFGLIVLLNVASSPTNARADEDNGILDCIYEEESLECAKKRTDAQLDAYELQVTGRQSSLGFSKVFEGAGELMVDGTRSFLGLNDDTTDLVENNEGDHDEGRSEVGEARKKFGHKKKKKLLSKLIGFSMLLKSKLSLLLQMISTHFQLKFFGIAFISLLVNIARFWLDFKKDHASKVVYYEHAQHQHHYDQHDDEHGGYWGRSDPLETPAQDMAYSAHKLYNQ